MVWKESLRGTSGMFFSLYTGVACEVASALDCTQICSYYKLEADDIMEQGRVLVLQWNKHPTQLIQKHNKK